MDKGEPVLTSVFSRDWRCLDLKPYGYSVLFVECADREELNRVADSFSPYGHNKRAQILQDGGRPWHDGRFDLIAVLEGQVRQIGRNGQMAQFPHTDAYTLDQPREDRGRSTGDHCFVGYYSAAEVLNRFQQPLTGTPWEGEGEYPCDRGW